MRLAMVCLLITLSTGCQGTRTVTEYQYHEITKAPNAMYLVACVPPFTAPPKTYGDAVVRDEVWLNAFRLCACKIEKNRAFYGYPNKTSACSMLNQKKRRNKP